MTEFDAEAPGRGLAAERTDLAWNRSGLALLGCGAVVLRGVACAHLATGRVAVGSLIVALGAVAWSLGAWHTVAIATESGARLLQHRAISCRSRSGLQPSA